MSEVTRILGQIEPGNGQMADKLLPLVYEELRRLAAAKVSREKPGQSLQATALVHEAYIRLVDQAVPQHWDSRRHFFAAAAEAMRRILIEMARSRTTAKHGGDGVDQDLDTVTVACFPVSDEAMALHEAMERLEAANPEAAEIVKLRFYAGFTIQETAALVGRSPRTVDKIWAYARAWLLAELSEQEQAEEKSHNEAGIEDR